MSIWVGYYEQGLLVEMNFTSVTLDENGGVFIAQGNDPAGCFRMEGTIENTRFIASKHYPEHQVRYEGVFDKEKYEIVGNWTIEGCSTGEFKFAYLKNDQIAAFRNMIGEHNRKVYDIAPPQLEEDDEDMGGLFS